MPSPEKQVSTHNFIDGIDSSTARELKRPSTAEYILNCHILSQGAGSVGIVTNVKGNKQIEFDLPEGENTCIGTAKNEETNNFYYLVQNSNGYDGIYKFNGLTKSITRLLLDITDTGGVRILNFSKEYLILHADVYDKNKLAWVDGLNNARKTNLDKLVDKSSNGYGSVVLQSFIDAYKQTDRFPPTAKYVSDDSKSFNRLYGKLFKFVVRRYYVDGEKSTFSDYSSVPLPAFEPFTGINTIPTANNCIEVSFSTGSKEVIQIEIGMQSTSGSVNDEGLAMWKSVAVIDKRRLNLSDESQYTYKFYNETDYATLDINEVIMPYSFMFKRPLCQAFVKNAMTHTNGYEGFDIVQVNADIAVTYEDLFLLPGVDNDFNEPYFNLGFTSDGADYVAGEFVTDYNGIVSLVHPNDSPVRFNRMTITIGSDVKKGNTFNLTITNGASDYFTFSYTAKNTDSSLTIANKVTQFLTGTGRIYRKTEELPDSNIYDQTNDAGNISFTFIFRSTRKQDYNGGSASVNPVQFNTLKDTGQSISNQKLGGSEKFAFEYEDFDGRKSNGYTNDFLIVDYKTINELEGFKIVIRTFTIKHRPPIWAKYWQLLRSPDLTYGDYIQLLIQKVVPVNNEDEQEFIDLVVGSLFTYQKIHPNTSLAYEFAKGDRLRLIKNADTQDYYDFFETEIIAYNTGITENIKDNLVTNGTATVTVSASNIGNVGKVILVDSSEREIIDAPTSTTYLLNNVIGKSGSGNEATYLHYDLIDRRGTIRIRKPSDITIADNSIVELYKPSGVINSLGTKQFFEFGKKFAIINAGTENAYHGGDIQDQTATLPAIVKVDEGTAYVRNRELPTNNQVPGTQIIVDGIEDPQFSDFYESLINDNGRVNTEDMGIGEVHFGSRTRFSKNYIEDTRINGLNLYGALDREDFNDQYGDAMLTKFDANRIFVFKELRSGIIPVDERITQDNNGLALNVSSAKLLNPIQYFAWEGGIGNNPESYASNGTQKYFLSPNSGVIIRIGGNGEEPISKTYYLDNKVKELISEALTNKARIFGGFDRLNGVYIVSIEGYNQFIFFDGFTGWVVEGVSLPEGTTFEIVTVPTHGTAVVSGFEITYTPTTDYVGQDSFTYRAFIAGVWSSPRKVCLTVNDVPSATAWRQKTTDTFCVEDEEGEPTGMRGFNTLEQYKPYDGSLTGLEKPNSPTDPDYVPPIYDPECLAPEPPVCPDRVLVFQICNSNSVIDDNFDIFLNDVYIGAVDLNQNAQIGSVFIGSLGTPEITSSDFVCPLEDMVTYYFDPAIIVGGINTVKMVNTQNNGSGNAGDVGVRNYLITGDELSAPCVVDDLAYSGASGSNFELEFNYTACCPEDEEE